MAKSLLAGIVLICMFSSLGWAATPSPTLIATPPQPKWSELTVPQKAILAPLADDWDSFEYYRQKQWLGITARFPTMSSGEQSRIQKQMQEWGKLTPAQRQKAREARRLVKKFYITGTQRTRGQARLRKSVGIACRHGKAQAVGPAGVRNGGKRRIQRRLGV